jgi:hypothetical protein
LRKGPDDVTAKRRREKKKQNWNNDKMEQIKKKLELERIEEKITEGRANDNISCQKTGGE